MIPDTENPQEAKRVYPGKPARHALADPGRYFTQCPQCWFSRPLFTFHRNHPGSRIVSKQGNYKLTVDVKLAIYLNTFHKSCFTKY